jgi:hypothetical protein
VSHVAYTNSVDVVFIFEHKQSAHANCNFCQVVDIKIRVTKPPHYFYLFGLTYFHREKRMYNFLKYHISQDTTVLLHDKQNKLNKLMKINLSMPFSFCFLFLQSRLLYLPNLRCAVYWEKGS